MNLYETIQINLSCLRSVYDLAALCYDYLLKKIDNQAIFVAEYLGFSDDSKQNNPNQKRLLKFSDEIKIFLSDDGYWNDHVLSKILSLVFTQEQDLKPYRMDVYNESAIAYFLLLGIDLYAEYHSEDNQNAPLNQCYRGASYIYRSQKTSILSNAAKENEFREMISLVEIRSNFDSLKILEVAELKPRMTPPKMVTLYIDENDFDRNSATFDQTLIIAVIPFGKGEICRFSHVAGSAFRIEYLDSYQENGIKKAVALLEMAIRHHANIVVFPEYTCSPEVQAEIQKYLRVTHRKSPHKLKELLLVIAGSGWTQDDNNVAVVYNYSGKLLGKQYKNASYDRQMKNPLTGEVTERWIEDLHDPGKESIIVEIPQIGRMMIGICRDVSSWDYSEKMARIFRTDFLMVPAWSPSLNHAFVNQLESLTEVTLNTCSVVCNCCAALSDPTREKGLVVTPYKKGSIIKGNTKMIRQQAVCAKRCRACTGCIFCLTLSFRTQDVEKGRILRSQRNFYQ